MVRWTDAKKQWKRSADEAIAPNRLGDERDRLAAEVAKRIWVANGGREWVDVRGEGSLLALESLVLRHLNDAVVRSALAMRHVAVLEDSVRSAEYEDTRSLDAERRWAEEYLQEAMRCSLVPGGGGQASPSGVREAGADRLEQLRAELAALLSAELKAASIAAA